MLLPPEFRSDGSVHAHEGEPMVLVIALVGAAVLLSALVLVVGRRERGQGTRTAPSANPAESGPAPDGRGAATRNTWTFGGGGGIP